ncbi:MAG TPA: hypothetical protein VKB31_09535 [Trueperaceae bacterium]|nr:hypothetical protein [Trueperaceae bacterium]
MGNVAARVLAPLALIVAPLWGGAALAFTPADIVAELPESERSLRQAAAVAAAGRGLGLADAGTHASLRVAPAVEYGADIEDPAALAASLDLGLELGWRQDRARALAARAELLRARERWRHWRRADVRDGLRLLGKTLRAEVALERAELDLGRASQAAARDAAATARNATPTAGNATPAARDAAAAAGDATPAASATAVRRAQALVAARRHALASLRADAAALGLQGLARLEAAGFALPAAPSDPPGRARLALALDAARLGREAAASEVLRDLSLAVTYESKSDRFQLSASLGLDRGRPEAVVAAELGSQQDDQWSVRLGADIRLDAGAADAQAAADERVRRAEVELAALESGYARRLHEARTAVEDAVDTFDAEVATWREEVAAVPAAGAMSAPDCRSLLARENAVYGAWLDVVGATYDYLEAVDGAWAVAPVPGAAGGGGPVSGVAGGDPWPSRPSACAPVRAAAGPA